MEIRVSDFSAGWTPCDDPINGRKNGLLRMENVELDDNGALSLAGGTSVRQSGYGSNAHTIYSRLINGTIHDYLALADGTVQRDVTQIATSGDSTNAAFGTACNTRKKDIGSGTPVNLGILPPTVKPTVEYSTADSPFAVIGDVITNVIDVAGTSAVIGPTPTYLQVTCDANGTYIGQTYVAFPTPTNLNALVDVNSGIGFALDGDYVQIVGYTPYVWGRKLQFDILLEAGDNVGTVVSNYYTFQVADISTLQYSALGTFTVRVRRDQFTRVGFGAQDWSTVYGFRLTYSGGAASEVVNFFGADIDDTIYKMIGGDKSQTGQYQYVQLNVNNTGSYLAKSVMGPLSNVINLDGGQTKITAQDPTSVDAQCNEAWIFRRGGNLDQWYRIRVLTSSYATPFFDNLSDQDALTLDITLNTNLVSIASGTITDKIFDIIGPVNGRWYYFTTNFMYPSDLNDPDLVDASLAVRICGSASELFMWARQTGPNSVLVGTSIDVYSLSGTFATFPDNSVDIYYLPTNCKYPPLTCDAIQWGGSVYYLANDGWRVLNGSGQSSFTGNTNPSLVSPNLDRLYRGETVEGYAPPNLRINPRSARFPIVIAKNKMWCFITGTSRIEVYDFIRQYWRVVTYGLADCTACTSTQDGKIIAFFGTSKKLREIDIHSSKLIDGATKQIPVIKTMVFDAGIPRQRKDSSTFKIRSYHTDAYTPALIVDGSATVNLLTSVTSNGLVTDQYQDISQNANVALVKTYQFQLSTYAQTDFLFDDFSILFDARPEQRTFIRVQGLNYGTTARKRIATIPFQLDSLGGLVTITPLLDGVSYASQTFISNRKESFNFEFVVSNDTLPLALDFEWLIHSSTLFEFFGFGDPRLVEVYAQQAKGISLPVNNYGTANKKRVRTQPFVLSSPIAGTVAFFTPLVDGVEEAVSAFILTLDKRTYFHFYETDVFGVDYGGFFTSTGEMELEKVLEPEIVQTLPIAKRFDQLGPEEFFRYGKIKMIELRVLAIGGTSIPFSIYFNDNTKHVGTFTVVNGKDGTYFIMLPKGTSGNVVRIELGPTNFDFHRFYTRLQIADSGADTDLKWINL